MKAGKIYKRYTCKWWVNPLCKMALLAFNLHLMPASSVSGFARFITRHGVSYKGIK